MTSGSGTSASAVPEVVVIGAGGMLGRAFCELLTSQGVSVLGLTRGELDLAEVGRGAAIDWVQLIPAGTRWVINCAAYTQVDKAETDYETAEAVNGHAVKYLCEATKAAGAKFVHYSTDYVFSGKATQPYPLDAPIAPCNAYGRSKALGEQRFVESQVPGLLLRTSWVYAPWGKNFVRTMARLLAEKPELRVVNDQKGRPTSAVALARNTWRLCQLPQPSPQYIGHLTDAGDCTWFDFATEIGRQLSLPARVIPCTTSEFPLPAVRPAYSVLDVRDSERQLGNLTEWRASLAEVLAQMQAPVVA